MTRSIKSESAVRDYFFQPFRAPKSDGAKQMVQEVIEKLQNYEKYFALRQRARKEQDQLIFKETVAAIVCDAAHRYLERPDCKIAISLSHRKLGVQSRYRASAMTKVLPVIVERLASPEMDFIEFTKGSRELIEENEVDLRKSKWKGHATVIWPGKRLLDIINEHISDHDDFCISQSEEVIILKAAKIIGKGSKRLEYTDDDYTNGSREKLRSINHWLERANIDCMDTSSEPFIDVTKRRLRRVYHNGSFEEGGRLWGGFWINMKKEARLETISIGEEAVTELDYGQMGLRLLYGLMGKNPPDGDLYTIPGLENSREGVKTLIHSALNVPKLQTRMPKGAKEKFKDLVSFGTATSMIKDYHRAVSDQFFSNIGMKLNRIESDLLLEVLLKLKGQGIVALPIHDGLLVADPEHEAAMQVMKETFQREIGVPVIVGIKG